MQETAMQGLGKSRHRIKEFGIPQVPHWESVKLKRDQ
jgi:hypothetical protein